MITLMDGCPDIEARVAAADPDLEELLTAWCSEVVGDPDLLEAAEGHLPRGGDDGARRRRLRQRLADLARRG